VANRSAIPAAKTASVFGSITENFREEFPQLMTRVGKGVDTPPPGIVLVLVLDGWGVSQRNRWTDFVDPLA
jgi:hypothetical protein